MLPMIMVTTMVELNSIQVTQGQGAAIVHVATDCGALNCTEP